MYNHIKMLGLQAVFSQTHIIDMSSSGSSPLRTAVFCDPPFYPRAWASAWAFSDETLNRMFAFTQLTHASWQCRE